MACDKGLRPNRGARLLAERMRALGLSYERVRQIVGARSDGTIADILSCRRKPGDDYKLAFRDRLGIPVDAWLEHDPERRRAPDEVAA